MQDSAQGVAPSPSYTTRPPPVWTANSPNGPDVSSAGNGNDASRLWSKDNQKSDPRRESSISRANERSVSSDGWRAAHVAQLRRQREVERVARLAAVRLQEAGRAEEHDQRQLERQGGAQNAPDPAAWHAWLTLRIARRRRVAYGFARFGFRVRRRGLDVRNLLALAKILYSNLYLHIDTKILFYFI